MHCKLSILLLFVFLLGAPVDAQAQELAFSLPSSEGSKVAIEPNTKLTAVCFLGTECPMARSYASTLSRLAKDFSDHLQVVGVMSNLQDSLEDIQNYREELDVRFPLLIDKNNVIADQFGATRTPEVYLLDQELKLRYHGRIDDQSAPSVAKAAASSNDLERAVAELIQGKPVSVKETRALGCVIGKLKKEPKDLPPNAITFYEHVKPVLNRNCIECHRAGEIGPFAMDEYEEVVGWADTMLETIEDGRMPPWHADPKVGHFSNARNMSDEDKQTLRDWLKHGTPEGSQTSTTALDSEQSIASDQWQFDSQPDLILPMRERPFVVPKDGVVEYQYFVVDPGFKEDKWIQGAQVLPGSRDVVHHAIVFVRPPDGSQFQGVGWLTAYVPGQRALKVPFGYARKVEAGSKLVFQMHYTPNGTRREDVTQVGLKFADPEQVTHRVITLMALNQDFEIPPGDAEHQVQADLGYLPSGGELLAVTPHMHYRGKSFEISSSVATEGEKKHQQILSVPRYDFNWQHTYQFAEPIALDDVEEIRFSATFDNSDENPFNPDPSCWVSWGDQTWEEMAVSFFEVSLPLNSRKSNDPRVATEDPAREARIEAYVEKTLKKLDKNGDGKIHSSEGSIFVRHFTFRMWDVDGDGVVTRADIKRRVRHLVD